MFHFTHSKGCPAEMVAVEHKLELNCNKFNIFRNIPMVAILMWVILNS